MSTPSSFNQESIWISRGNSSASAVFNLLWSLTFKGPLKPALLGEALSNILSRHAALRSTFRWVDTKLEIDVLPDVRLELAEESLQIGEVSSPEAAIKKIGHSFGSAPYDLERGPLYRFKLVRISASHHVLLCGFHHLVIDGTSWKLLVEELISLLGHNGILEPVAPYLEFVTWQKRQVNSEQWIKAQSHWNELVQSSHRYFLPGSKPDSRTSEREGAQFDFRLDGPTTQALRNTSLKFGVSPFRLALSAFLSFLYALTGQEGLFVATTLVGRPPDAYKKTVGLFVNTALVGLSDTSLVSFKSLAIDIEAQLNEALLHETYPYSFAMREWSKKRDLSRELNVPVSFTKLPSSAVRHVNALTVLEQRVFLNAVDRDLSVYMQDECGDYHFTWIYRSALFDSATISRYAEEFQSVLRQALESPLQAIRDFDIVSASERLRMLVDWNQTDKPYPQSRCLHSLFHAQAACTPDRIALITMSESFTYKRINEISERLARFLCARGVGSGNYIPLILKSSAELMLAEIAVIKTGAAFCPIDPEWPASRIQALIKQLDARFIIRGSAAESTQFDLQYESIFLSDFMREEDSETPHNTTTAMVSESMLDTPLYCHFTSGSTGDPKGAINHHRGIVNRLFAMNDLFGAATEDMILATASASADTLVWQYFWPLISGGRCIVAPREEVVVPERIVGLFKQHPITFTDFVPSIFQLLVHHLELHPEALAFFGKLRRVLIGGDVFPVEAAKRFRTLLPHVAITNTYGPTETSIGVIFHEYDGKDLHSMPIGKPIANVKAVVVDDALKLRPFGAVGELCLGGACVGLGYLADPILTSQKFIPNPFPELGCTTLYRTGDLVRYRSSGVLEFLGRIDDQIKIQGIRIEPSEIEVALTGYSLVAAALVVCASDKNDVKQLVAYVCAHDPSVELKQSALRQFLLGILPHYMVPAIFIQTPALPLTSSGKIARNPQEILHTRVLSDQRRYAAPRNVLETKIVCLWQAVLGQNKIGVDDHFFADLGGESLSAMVFVARFKEQTGVDLSMLELYEYPTPRLLAEHFTQQRNAVVPVLQSQSAYSILEKQRLLLLNWQGRKFQSDSLLFTLNETGVNSKLFWCFQGYDEFRELSRQMGNTQPITGMRSGHLVMRYTKENIEILAARYASEMMQLQPTGTFIIGGNCQGAIIAEAIARTLKTFGRIVSLLIFMEYRDFRTYDGHVALIFGRDSQFNPYKEVNEPRVLFDPRLPKSYTLDLIEGEHGQFFRGKNLASLSIVLTKLLN